MSFKSVIKKIGEDINKADQAIPVWGGLIHAVTSAIPGINGTTVDKGITVVQDKLDQIQSIVVDAEAFGQAAGLKGEDLAKGIGPAVTQVLIDMPLIKGKKPKDPEAAKAIAAKIGGLVYDYLNQFEAS